MNGAWCRYNSPPEANKFSRSGTLPTLSGFSMAKNKITTYVMLTPEYRYQIEQEILARCTVRIAGRLPLDSPEPEEDEEFAEEDKEEG